MNKEEKLKKLNDDFDRFKYYMESTEAEIKLIESKTELSRKDLIIAYEEEDKEILTVEKYEGDYEQILGGDGRSRPWSEQRQGNILEIKISDKYYISSQDLSSFKGYITGTSETNGVNYIKMTLL